MSRLISLKLRYVRKYNIRTMLQAGNHKLEGFIRTARTGRKGKYKKILTYYHTRTHVATTK